jgi:hypothetical protein
MKSDNLAPIVLFVYSRLWHTKQTIEALKKNKLASESELFIYADAPKNEASNQQVSEVRRYIRQVEGFKNISIIERQKNLGLAKSIIYGVSETVEEYGKVIVLEDDLVTSPLFLTFMNDALNFYANDENVMHISGWNYPCEFITNNDVYLYRTMDCWGWGTWRDSWSNFEKNTAKLVTKFTREEIHLFNLDGYNHVWNQVLMNKYKRIDTWAIYWYASIFKKDGLCLNPVKSFVKNIGHDGSGVHCDDSFYEDNLILNTSEHIKFVQNLHEDENMVGQIKEYFKNKNKHIAVRLINKLSRMVFGKNLIK